MKAIITGITGQDGYFLSKLLYEKGYEIHGVIRRNSSMSKGTMAFLSSKIRDVIKIHYGELTDANFFAKLLSQERPDEIYHLAAQSFVGYSFLNPASTYDTNISGALNVANAVKDYSPNTKIYFAATSEMYGQPEQKPQNEDTPFRPRSPYAISKLAGFWTMKTYRDAYGLFVANGILFNHESEVRGPEFVTRKVSIGVSKIAAGSDEPIELGNLDARKDWGYAKDHVEAMWKMMKYEKGDDFVVGTGETHTVREFVSEAFYAAGISIRWEGTGLEEKGVTEEGRVVVRVKRELFRPLEAENYLADYSKARKILGWSPKTTFKELVKIMVENDMKRESNKDLGANF